MPPLAALLASEKERKEVQEAAAGSLGKLGSSATRPLIDAARDNSKDAAVRKRAVDSLGTLGPDARAALPDLTDILNGKTKNNKKAPNPDAATNDIRLEVAAALGSIANSKDEDVLKALETISTDKANKKNKELNKVINKAIKDIKDAATTDRRRGQASRRKQESVGRIDNPSYTFESRRTDRQSVLHSRAGNNPQHPHHPSNQHARAAKAAG